MDFSPPAVTGASKSSQTRLNAGGISKRPWCPRHVSGLVKHTKSPCVAPETEARRQRFCAEVVGDSGHVTARRRHQSSTRSVNRVAARRSGARRRRTTYLDPRFNRLCSTENPEITLFAFVYVKVSFVLFCFVFVLFSKLQGAARGRNESSRLSSCRHKLCCYGAAGKHPTCCCCLSLQPQKRRTQPKNRVLI